MEFTKIILPTRPQPDTIVGIFILRKFGEEIFPGVLNARVEVLASLPEGKAESEYETEGTILIDIGGGKFDHHNKERITASLLIAQFLKVEKDPSISKLLEYARRDDFFGKGTLSNDALDKAFGLSGLISSLNKVYGEEPNKVVEYILPLLEAHFIEEERRTKHMPAEVKEKIAKGEASPFSFIQRGRSMKGIFIESDNPSLPGYLRSSLAGSYDVVAQKLGSGHVNVLSRQPSKVDLRSLALVIRVEEAAERNIQLQNEDPLYLSNTGRIYEIKDWFYDPATNSLLNGGLNPKDISPTTIAKEKFITLLGVGLSESVWKPE